MDLLRERSWPGRLGWLLDFPAAPLMLAGLALGVVAGREPRTRRFAWFALAWLLAAWVFARSTGRSYPHYFVGVTAPLALLIGAGADVLGRRAPQVRVAVAVLALAAACLPLALENWRSGLKVPAGSRWMAGSFAAIQSVDEAAAKVRAITRPDDRVFVATYSGGTSPGIFLYWLADRRPAYRIFYPGDVVPPRFDEVSAALAADPPDVLVMIPGTATAPYEAAIANGRLRVVARYPGWPGDDLEVYARPGLG